MNDVTPAQDITDEMVQAAAAVLRGCYPLNVQLSERMARAALEKALAGRVVVDLPEPDGVDGDVTVWSYSGTDEVHAYVEDGRPHVGYMYTDDDPDQAEALGLALVAAAREARRLAVSPKGGETND